MSIRPKRLLISGLYVPGSGLTNVISVLMRELSAHYELRGLGFQFLDFPASSDSIVEGCPMHITGSQFRVFMPDPGWLENCMHNFRPEGIVVIGPPFLTLHFLGQLQDYRTQCPIILYLPLEGKIVNPDIIGTLKLVDHCILYTEYARLNMIALCETAVKAGVDFRRPVFSVVGHGVDTADFFPISERIDAGGKQKANSALKEQLFPGQPELHDSFIILNANRAYYRKRLDLTIAGFALFAKEHPKAYLYLHTGTTALKERIHLQELIDNSGASKQILLNVLNPEGEKVSTSRLNLLYNLCDVGITTAMGEGWGLASFEHAATGAPQIVPDHTSFSENWTGKGILLDISSTEYVFYELADMYVVAPESVAEALALVCTNRMHYDQMAKAGYDYAKAPSLAWSAVALKFTEILEIALI
ncbi:glycosyltransferase [Flavobacterium kingsejongi]|uniref:Glycosyl transferase family 1 domain-containing protein n=1 Tax=Flavobacterium kingsejongi TaxID=1678728 RepID=A0A2S1LNG6_9FLAO|nr:glycosyltransferase [Flavobacterium kingsejongi]AWG25259.1 hypothetical protein FK004_08435 [Flavobacterium kingsejongi]